MTIVLAHAVLIAGGLMLVRITPPVLQELAFSVHMARLDLSGCSSENYPGLRQSRRFVCRRVTSDIVIERRLITERVTLV
jgi:hypothetical protein